MEYDELMDRAKYSSHYQTCLAEVKRLEPAFLALRDSLPEDQRQVLEAYLSACEEMDHALLDISTYVTDELMEEWVEHFVRREAYHQELKREIRERGPRYRAVVEHWKKIQQERSEEYLEYCRMYNRIASEICAETDVQLPLIDSV